MREFIEGGRWTVICITACIVIGWLATQGV